MFRHLIARLRGEQVVLNAHVIAIHHRCLRIVLQNAELVVLLKKPPSDIVSVPSPERFQEPARIRIILRLSALMLSLCSKSFASSLINLMTTSYINYNIIRNSSYRSPQGYERTRISLG